MYCSSYYLVTDYYISWDGGETWTESRLSHDLSDPELNAPVSPSGLFYGDYQGLVADLCTTWSPVMTARESGASAAPSSAASAQGATAFAKISSQSFRCMQDVPDSGERESAGSYRRVIHLQLGRRPDRRAALMRSISRA